MAWYTKDGSIKTATEGLDLNDVVRAAKKPYAGAPDGLMIGHFHLQVGNMGEAEKFYRDIIGIPVTSHFPGAAFYGSGGYHHHIATNLCNSHNAKARAFPATGFSGDWPCRSDAAG